MACPRKSSKSSPGARGAPRRHRRMPPRHASAAVLPAPSRRATSSPTIAPPACRSRAPVARGDLHEDTYFYTGKNGDIPGDALALSRDQRRARSRPRAFQHQLHALSRPRRRWWRIHSHPRIPSSAVVFTSSVCANAPIGHFFRRHGPIGYGVMPDYASQVTPARPLVHCHLHSRLAVEPECDGRRHSAGQQVPSPPPSIPRYRQRSHVTRNRYARRVRRGA